MSKTSSDNFTDWMDQHQPFELDYHSKDNYRWHDSQFLPAWKSNFGDFLGLKPDYFNPDDLLIDIGCGSRPALSYFSTGDHCNVDPLLSKYFEIPQVSKYWPPTERELAVGVPAEKLIGRCAGNCSFVNCWNVLDHCHDWPEVLTNIFLYAKPGAIIAICTDTTSHGVGHPGIEDPGEMMQMITDSCHIERMEINYGVTVKRDIALKLRRRA